MKVLFISSGNNKSGISPIVKAQGESLIKANVGLNYYLIKGKGFKGYLKNILPLMREIKNGNYDIIHSHYGDSSILAALANRKRVKLIISFMGSDILFHRNNVKYNIIEHFHLILYKIIAKYFAKSVIVKSIEMKDCLWKGSNIHIIPNGVDLNTFKPLKHKVNKNIRSSKKVLFISDKLRSEKNYYLLKSAVHLLKNRFKIEIINPTNLTPVELNKEYNSAHVLTLTSIYEGSPNVIKEAMACNLSIVSTDIGDVRKVIGETAGCYIAKNNSMDYSEKLTKALQFKGSTKGRERIINLGLDSKAISERLINLYQS